jgi:hypothetical protein
VREVHEGELVFQADVLTFQEFKTREPLPLARIHEAVLGFLRDRGDAVLFGAHAVHAYIDELLLAHPELKAVEGAVAERIHILTSEPEPEIMDTWREFVALDLHSDDEDEGA